MKFAGETIWVIGASSGIGYELSKELSRQGATLVLSSRNREGLEKLVKETGRDHHIYPLDVARPDDITRAVEANSSNHRIDRVIYMAAVYEPLKIEAVDFQFARHLVEVNLLGAIYVSSLMIPIFRKQGFGQIVLCGSVAGYTGLPNGQPYSATKAGIINFAESLYAEVDDFIDVKLISPGFVRTPATDKNSFQMPARIESDVAARYIARGLQKRAFEIHFPRRFTLLLKMFSLLPYFVKLFFLRRL